MIYHASWRRPRSTIRSRGCAGWQGPRLDEERRLGPASAEMQARDDESGSLLCVFASRLSSTAPVTPSSLSGPVVGELHLGAELVGERDQREVLCVQMLLDLERVVEDGVCV